MQFPMRMTNRLMRSRGLRQDCTGAATVEFAVVTVSAIALLPLLWDMTAVVSSSMSLSSSMRAGIQYATSLPSDNAGIAAVIRTAGGFPDNSVTVTTNQSCECSGLITSCGSNCAGGGQPAMYETITANYSVPTFLPYADYPSNAFPISRTVSVRVQ